MKMLKLTKKSDSVPVYISPIHIVWMEPNSTELGTIIHLTNGDTVYVKESTASITTKETTICH